LKLFYQTKPIVYNKSLNSTIEWIIGEQNSICDIPIDQSWQNVPTAKRPPKKPFE
jgi:hypothetical protein